MRLIPLITKFYEIVTVNADSVKKIEEVFETDIDRSGPFYRFKHTHVQFAGCAVDLPIRREAAVEILEAPLADVKRILRSGYGGKIRCAACSEV